MVPSIGQQIRSLLCVHLPWCMWFKQCFCCGTLGHSWHLVSRETTRKWDENGQTYAIPGRGRVKRPSDASVGKLTEGTATDWVTRGHLINLFSVVSDVVRFLVIFQMLSPQNPCLPDWKPIWFQISRFQILRNPTESKEYGGSMYSRANVSDNASVATRKRAFWKGRSSRNSWAEVFSVERSIA